MRASANQTGTEPSEIIKAIKEQAQEMLDIILEEERKDTGFTIRQAFTRPFYNDSSV